MRQGDESAFATLFHRHKTSVYRYAVHMAGRGASGDDVVQEVFLAFLRQLSQYDGARGSVQSYLLGIARRQVFKQLGHAIAADSLDDVEDERALESRDAGPFEQMSRAETAEHVRAAIDALPPLFREAIVLCELNELDYASAAEIMKCPVGTVRSRLHRAKSLLAGALGHDRVGSGRERRGELDVGVIDRVRSHG